MSEENKKKEFVPAPEGTYKIRMEKFQIKDTKAGTGQYVDCMFEIMGGSHECEGWKVFEKYNFKNPNPKAEEISKILLGHYLTAVGYSETEKTEILTDLTKLDDALGIPFIAELKIKDEGSFGKKNRIAKYLAK